MKKVLTVFLSIVLILAMMPSMAFAENVSRGVLLKTVIHFTASMPMALL